jgi:hypothetical protein
MKQLRDWAVKSGCCATPCGAEFFTFSYSLGAEKFFNRFCFYFNIGTLCFIVFLSLSRIVCILFDSYYSWRNCSEMLKTLTFVCSEMIHRNVFCSFCLYGCVNCGIYWPINKMCVHAIYQTALTKKSYILSHSINAYIQVCGFSMTSGISEFIQGRANKFGD